MSPRKMPPDSPELTFLCGLSWPEMERCYISRRHPGCWDFWVLRAGETETHQLFAILDEPGAHRPSFKALDFYLKNYREKQLPDVNRILDGELRAVIVQMVIDKHLVRIHVGDPTEDFQLTDLWEGMLDGTAYELPPKPKTPERSPGRVLPFRVTGNEDEDDLN